MYYLWLAKFWLPCSVKILREFYFADWRFFGGLRKQILAVRDAWNFWWELILRFSVQVAEYLSGRNLNMVFSTFILRFTSPLKAEFLIWLKGFNFCGVLFWGFFFLRELIFADRGQSAKFAKIRTRKIFMLYGSFFVAWPCLKQEKPV